MTSPASAGSSGGSIGLTGLHLAALALAAWVATGWALWPAVAAAGVVTGLLLRGRSGLLSAWAGILLATGVVVALSGEWHLHRLAEQWPERSERRAEAVRERLAEEVDELVVRGERAADEAVRRWRAASPPTGPELPSGVRSRGVDAIALFGEEGELLAWTGTHQGPFPEDVRWGSAPYLYREGALFGYLYVIRPLGDERGVAVAAFLMRADLPPTLEPPRTDFLSRFERATGATLRLSGDSRPAAGGGWELRRGGRTLFHVTMAPPSEADARASRELAWSRAVVLLLLPAWLLAVIGSRAVPGGIGLAAGSLPLLLLVLPLVRVTGGGRIFSPADFLLPGPVGLTLGDLLALAAGLVVVLGLRRWSRHGRLPAPVAAVGAGGMAVGVLHLLAAGASRDFLAGPDGGWVAFQGAATLLLAIPFALAVLLSAPGRAPRSEGREGAGVAVALLGAVSLGVGAAVLIRGNPAFPSWAALLWILPLWGLARSLPADRGWLSGGGRWVAVMVVAVSLALPWAWAHRVDARMAAAAERIDRLGTRPDPFLEFLLQRAGGQAAVLAESGRGPVEVLYRAWSDGGLAWEGVPLWLTYWSVRDEPREELRIGVGDNRPSVPSALLDEARLAGEVVIQRHDLADAHYIAAAPLPGGEAITFVVPPRRVLAGASPFGPLFSPARVEPDPIVLIPLLPGEIPGRPEAIRWVRTPEGWQGEVYLAFPDEVYHAHYHLDLPGPLLITARATLLLLVALAGAILLWALGRSVGAGWPGGARRLRGAVGSFRGRVTVALFAFFLLPAILFGMLSWRTLSGAAVRTAEALAERAVADAAGWYHEVGGAVDILADRVGSDLLLYDGGELVAGSLRELVELGLYEGWVPPAIHRHMTEGEEVMTTTISSLGGWEYVVAYRRVAGGRVLAAPAPLQAGALALRQRDVADLLGFAAIAGGILSVLLALLVGRALTRPIQTLRIASERVGAGNMGVHLPPERDDEFGTVFEAFNRMVDNLSSTRRALVRSSRRTRAIVEEVATGVVALDSQGRVRLVNPRAEELLGASIPVDLPLAGGADDAPVGSLAAWVDRYFRDGAREATTELSLGDRRIRVRARRISGRGPRGGAVISLEDVTDELRTERILAWGEMARQVAHEVKNPLTPIKLGIQHIRRAWEDGRADFEGILTRNVDAILGEIDRLASISTSFSRFGAPGPAGTGALEEVDVARVASEILDLYAASEGPIQVRLRVEAGLPAVRARSRELKEVLVNLLENARAAMPEGGEVVVWAREAEPGVEIRVIDEGPGIPDDLRPRVFEPHFSTRSGGSGLGLAIVRRLVESWEGRVEIGDASDRGTTVRIFVPRWEEEGSEGDGGDGLPSGS